MFRSSHAAWPGCRGAERELHVVATAHLDTQWLWTIQDTINRCLPNTLRGNFALFERFPGYQFSFEGAFRYMLAAEYYPAEFARLQEYVAAGRWHVCGSFVDACDTNIPAPEALLRQILYGNRYFQRTFGRTSADIFLPDCFGFGYALPTIAAHCGLRGFSSQKLTWGSSVGIPFEIGLWRGVDGRGLIAALNPGDYTSRLRVDLSADAEWRQRIDALGAATGLYAGYKYIGVGDEGGAPDDETVSWLMRSLAGDGPVRVLSSPADALFRALTDEQVARLPVYDGELLMTRHGVGCYTSQGTIKRWNRQNELLADAAERAAVLADWLGAAEYPRARLTEAWTRFLWHQFHDDLTGTSIPQVYTFTANDEVLALGEFAGVLTDAVGGVARALDTRAGGVPVVVYNALSTARCDVVEATVTFDGPAPAAVEVLDPAGRAVPAQVTWTAGARAHVVFTATVPAVGLAVYDVRPAAAAGDGGALQVSAEGLENEHYRVTVDADGNVTSIVDKATGRELLSAPLKLQLLRNQPRNWPEWEIEYDDLLAAPAVEVGGPARVRVVEAGPARVALEIERRAAASTFVQRVRLGAGDAGRRVEILNELDWRSGAMLLKAAFPLTAGGPQATYDLGCGTIARGNNRPELYEVPAQQWADLSAGAGAGGVTIASDSRYGWDKPDDHTLRLTLVHTPGRIDKDMGWHACGYALVGHAGDWRAADAAWQAARFNQPLRAFQAPAAAGPLGRTVSLLGVSTAQVMVRAVKLAEDGREVVVRLQELHGRPVEGVKLTAAAPIVGARELDGSEQPRGELTPVDGGLSLALGAYELRTIALTLGAPPASAPVALPLDRCVTSGDGQAATDGYDAAGRALPAELFPREVVCDGVRYVLGPAEGGRLNAVTARGQTVALPEGEWDAVYVLAAAAGDDVAAAFAVDGVEHGVTVHAASGFVGQAESLVVGGRVVASRAQAPAYIKPGRVAWYATHLHDAVGANCAYEFGYVFAYRLPAGRALTLPRDERVRVLAVSVARNPNAATGPAAPLHDELVPVRVRPGGGMFAGPTAVELSCDVPGAAVHYTLDGTVPGPDSPRYTAPLTLGRDTWLAARVVVDGVPQQYVTRAGFHIVAPRAADQPARVVPGLRQEYYEYEGDWRRLPDFATLSPVSAGVVDTLGVGARRRDQRFALRLTGYIRVPEDGVYVLATRSDDGTRLWVGEQLVVDNDGLHTMVEEAGEIALRAGLHAVRLEYFQNAGGFGLEAWICGPETEKQALGGAWVGHAAR